ncbi:DNA-binding transcriptional repressor DeoR [Orbus sturtevantii]|uniref:DNA-binding transcriptional repressor DeoR n=1 Tax=Orbus sturtevantii TaxID=3074109 RepID=UPI00370D600E
MSKRQERVKQLIELSNKYDNLHIKDAAKSLNVSEMTIRRDLSNVASYPLYLLGGYIVYNKEYHSISQYFMSEQQQRNVSEKKYIAHLAASLVQNNEMIFFDCGTTIPYIIEYIPEHIYFTGLCYSLNVFLALQKRGNCKIILCGGIFESDNAIFTSINELSPLDIICPSKSFISAAGISLKGVTCFNLPEVIWKTKAIGRANTNVLVADSSKFDGLKSACFAQLSDFDIIISDHISDKYLAYCKKSNITIYQ